MRTHQIIVQVLSLSVSHLQDPGILSLEGDALAYPVPVC